MAHDAVPNSRPDAPGPSPLLARVLSWVVLALMAVATAYTAWIALANFNRIGV